ERIHAAAGRDVRAVYAGEGNRIWTASTTEGVELWQDDERIAQFAIDGVHVIRGTAGGVHAGAADGLWRLSADRAEKLADSSSIYEIQEDGSSLWLQTAKGFHRWDGGRMRPVALDGYVNKSRQILLTAPDGKRWVHSRDSIRVDDDVVVSGVSGITSLLAGASGNIWAGTGEGLLRIRRAPFTNIGPAEGLRSGSVYPVVLDGKSLLVGTLNAGWARVELDSGIIETHAHPQSARTLVRDAAGNLWIGGDELCRFSSSGCVADAPFRIAEVYALHIDRSGALWAGSRTGLFRRSREASWTRFDGRHGLPPRHVRVIADAAGDGLWLGTAGDGLLYFDGRRFRRFTTADGLPSNLIRGIAVDPDGSVWIGTENLGLAHLRLVNDRPRVTSIRASDGLYDENIHQILGDGRGRLWMSSNRGIFWIARKDLEEFLKGKRNRVRSMAYTERHGLRNREANGGVQSAGAVDHRGWIWFPTQGGLVGIDPRAFPFTRDPPPVRLEGVKTKGKESGTARDLRLGPKTRDFSVAYTALSFTLPERVRFRYRLEGFDDSWVESADRREAFYTNVPPGRYTFRVAASYDGEVWGEAPHPVEIEIAPYFYETAWFRGAVVAGFLALLPITAWARTRQLDRKKRALEDLVDGRTRALEAEKTRAESALARIEEQAEALAELDRLKSRFFANVSHELRTPLTMIIGPLTDLLERDGEGGSREQLVMMRRNALRLLRLVNQILDLHRLEAGGLELQRSVRDLASLVWRVSESFIPFAESTGIRLSINLPDRPVPVSFDPEQMEKVVGNLLSNAVKFTPRNGTIDVSLSRDEKLATLSVSNSGPAIDVSELDLIFNRYYRGSKTTLQEGSGIGLALVRELVELHEGRIGVESREQRTTFAVRLDLAEEAAIVVGEEDSRLYPIAAAAPKITESLGTSHRRETLLIVEDNVDVQHYIRSVLEAEYRIVTASDGRDGLEKAKRNIPDLIISDVMMPVMDGVQMVSELRKD
ncbi:MAG TPA: ATP-binding protein, partial [Thermoanaerobaculia bacterium]